MYRSGHPEVFCKKVFLENLQNSHKNTCARVSFLIKLQSSTLQLYSKRHSGKGAFKNMFLIEHLRATASNIMSPLRNSVVSQNFKKETLLGHAFYSKFIFLCQNSFVHAFCSKLIYFFMSKQSFNVFGNIIISLRV